MVKSCTNTLIIIYEMRKRRAQWPEWFGYSPLKIAVQILSCNIVPIYLVLLDINSRCCHELVLFVKQISYVIFLHSTARFLFLISDVKIKQLFEEKNVLFAQ